MMVTNEIKEFYRKKMEWCSDESEDVMKRFCDFEYNRCKPIMVDYATIENLIDKHGEKGVIIVSAYREDADVETNDQNIRTLLSYIQKNGCCYLPIYGCRRDLGQEAIQYIPSFLVFNKPKNDTFENRDFSELLETAKRWCDEYGIIKYPDMPDMSLGHDTCIYVNCVPCSIVERRMRKAKGEIMLY